jgi:hypothetical protein
MSLNGDDESEEADASVREPLGTQPMETEAALVGQTQESVQSEKNE